MSSLQENIQRLDRLEETVRKSDAQRVMRQAVELDDVAYDTQRKKLAKQAGIRVSTLDGERKKLRAQHPPGAGTKSLKTEGSGRELTFDEPELWPQPVSGVELLAELHATFARYVVMPNQALTTCALWAIHTWTHEAARVSPILAVTSPEKRCGKTTLLEVLGALCRRSLATANITAASLYRTVEKYRPTLLVDEADTYFGSSDELRGILNSGHRRRSAIVTRCVGEDSEPRIFSTWAPKAIALIGKLHPTLSDRSIEIALRRRSLGETVQRWRDDSFPELRRKLARWAADNKNTLTNARPESPAGLHDRELDNWEPLFAIAETAGGEWPQRARQAAIALSRAEDDSARVMLLADIQGLFNDSGSDWIPSAELCGLLAEMESRPWPEWGRAHKPITPRQLAGILEPFGIKPKPARREGASAGTRGYFLADFSDAFKRYLSTPPDSPISSATVQQPSNGAASSDFSSATGLGAVADGNPRKPAPHLGCCTVALENTPLEGVLI